MPGARDRLPRPAASRASTRRGPALGALVPVAIVAGGLWLYGTPAEYVLGGKDPGGYVNEGVQIAQRGALVAHRPGHRLACPPSSATSSSRRTTRRATTARASWASSCIDPEAGTVLGQFPHFLPASIAIGYGLDGLTGVRARDALLDAARPGRGLRLRRPAVRPDRRRGRHGAPRHQRHRGVVQRLSERRGRGPDAAVRGDARLVAGAGRRAAVLRPGGRVAARHAAVPARRHGDCARRLRRRGGARPDGRTGPGRRLLSGADDLAGRVRRSTCSA